VSLVEDPAYRQAKLGCEELDWDRIATHFGGRRRACAAPWLAVGTAAPAGPARSSSLDPPHSPRANIGGTPRLRPPRSILLQPERSAQEVLDADQEGVGGERQRPRRAGADACAAARLRPPPAARHAAGAAMPSSLLACCLSPCSQQGLPGRCEGRSRVLGLFHGLVLMRQAAAPQLFTPPQPHFFPAASLPSPAPLRPAMAAQVDSPPPPPRTCSLPCRRGRPLQAPPRRPQAVDRRRDRGADAAGHGGPPCAAATSARPRVGCSASAQSSQSQPRSRVLCCQVLKGQAPWLAGWPQRRQALAGACGGACKSDWPELCWLYRAVPRRNPCSARTACTWMRRQPTPRCGRPSPCTLPAGEAGKAL
jgi:hypothetical protein